jgi:aldehyde dehydrogenase (NAD+)
MQDLVTNGIIRKDRDFGHFVNGESLPAASSAVLPVINPSTGETICGIAAGDSADIDRAVSAAQLALASHWGSRNATERGRLLLKLAAEVLEYKENIARIEALDTGKPLQQALNDVVALARYFEFYGGAADKVHGESIPYQNGYSVFTKREPHGITGHIIPWNYPVQMFGRSVAPALAMGNACIVKPAEDASLSSLMVAWLALEVGFPPGALNIVTGYGESAGAALTAHPEVAYISFTGSPQVGTLVQQAAALHHKPVALELGGKSPQILFEDADQDAALPFVLGAIIQNAGQTCSAGSRLLLHSAIYDEFIGKLARRFSQLRVGASASDPDVGPVINARQQRRIMSYLELARNDGILIVAQGSLLPDAPANGFYVLPTLLGDVPVKHRLCQEEIFGPVLTVTRFESEAEAIAIANDTPFGLVAGVWTANGGRQLRVANALRCGQVYINNYGAGGGVEMPFGGVKRSGHGREKGLEALYHFSVTKTIAIKYS